MYFFSTQPCIGQVLGVPGTVPPQRSPCPHRVDRSPQQPSYFDFEFDVDEAQAQQLPSLDAAQCEMMMLEVASQEHRSPDPDALTVSSSSSDDEQARGSGKRKRCSAAECPAGGARAMPRSVSFSKSSVIRVTEIVVQASSPLPVELKTDHEATIKREDGPRPAATLLDDLIVVRTPAPWHLAAAPRAPRSEAPFSNLRMSRRKLFRSCHAARLTALRSHLLLVYARRRSLSEGRSTVRTM